MARLAKFLILLVCIFFYMNPKKKTHSCLTIDLLKIPKSPLKTHHVKSILAAVIYIESHLDERLPLAKLAKIAHISPYYFHRLFQRYLSISPGEYIKQSRLFQSAIQLQYSQSLIADIAFAIGYEDASSFSRAFFQLTGKYPRVYRKEIQNRFLQLNQQLVRKKIPEPQYIKRAEQTVLFLRKKGDYRETVSASIQECRKQLAPQKAQAITCYGMALDDPALICRDNCRFDLCISLPPSTPYQGLWGRKILEGGKYAVFTHEGPFYELEEVFTGIFYFLHCKEKLRFSGVFCEYIDLIQAATFSPTSKIKAKYYVPLVE